MVILTDLLRLLLSLGLLGMVVLAAFYLRSRKLSFSHYLGWGLLIVLIPLLGPFLTILAHPGLPDN
jgi:hypothetical protein